MKFNRIILVSIFALLVSCDGGTDTSFSSSKYYRVGRGYSINILLGDYRIIKDGIIHYYGSGHVKEDESVFYMNISYGYVKVVDGAIYASQEWHDEYDYSGNLIQKGTQIDKSEATYKYAGLINNGVFRSEYYGTYMGDMYFNSLYVTLAHAKKAGLAIYDQPN